MLLETLTPDEAKAVDRALHGHRALMARYANDRDYLANLSLALLGYSGIAERLAADAMYKLDYVLQPRLDALTEGDSLHLEGVTFTHVKRKDGALTVTAVDDAGHQRFRLKWKPDALKSMKTEGRFSVFDMGIQSCPPEDPQYPYAEFIARAHLSRDVCDRVESTTSGSLHADHFFAFTDAMGLLRPALAADISAMPRALPMSDKVPYSHAELDRMMIADIVKLDGGLAGRLAEHAVSFILRERGRDILLSLAERCAVLAHRLETDQCLWRGAALTTHDRDNVFFAVPSQDGRLGLLVNARNTCGPHTAFLAWKDDTTGKATIVAAEGGRNILEVTDAFVAGHSTDAATVSIDLTTGEHDLGREFLSTAILDLALCHVRFLEEDLKKVDDGRAQHDYVFEVVEDFDVFLESAGLSDEDEPEPESFKSLAP